MVRKNSAYFFPVVLILIETQVVWAMNVTDLLKQSVVGAKEQSVNSLSAPDLVKNHASQTARIDAKNTVQLLSSQPSSPQPKAAATMEASTNPAQQVGFSGASSYPFLYFDSKIKGRGY